MFAKGVGMSVIEAMAMAYLDALAPRGFRDAEEREAAALQRIGPMRAALAEARKLGWQLVPVEPTDEMFDAAGEVLWGNPRAKADEWAKTDKFESWAASGVKCYRAMLAAAPSIEGDE